jgi:hypothetical protein
MAVDGGSLMASRTASATELALNAKLDALGSGSEARAGGPVAGRRSEAGICSARKHLY